MSLFDDASLVLIPDGAKDGTLYSVKPTDGTGDFTFTRGSNLAATRVDVNGLIEKGRENLLLYSNDITNAAWLKASMNISSGYTSYNGISTAFKLIPNTTSTFHRIIQSQSWAGDVRTASFYAKADGYNIIRIVTFTGATDISLAVDLSDGSIVQESGATKIATNVESVGNEWYRISLTASGSTITSIFSIQIYVYEDAALPSAWSGDGTSGVLFADPQRELGLVATDYIETGATTAQAGILEDMPRLDYSGGTCPALLLEPQRTNVLPHSEYFDAWTKFNSSVEVNAVASLDGYANASKLIPNTSASSHQINYSISGGAHTTSVFAKAGEYSTLALFYTVHDGRAVFNLSSGTITETSGTVTASIEDFGNGWYRCILSTTLTTHDYIRIYAINGTTWADTSVAGDGTSGIYIYGAMLESGSYPTSYIPTYGSSVTRSADSCSKTGISSLIGQTEGTMFVEFRLNKVNLPNNHTWIAIKDLSQNNRILIYMLANQTTLRGQIKHSGTAYNLSFGTVTDNQNVKIAFAYKSGDSAVYINGSSVATDTNTLTFGTMDIFDFNDSSISLDGEINQAILFPTRLSNTELAALTTI